MTFISTSETVTHRKDQGKLHREEERNKLDDNHDVMSDQSFSSDNQQDERDMNGDGDKMAELNFIVKGKEENRYALVKTTELPRWLVDNPYIVGWCRKPDLNWWECVFSAFRLHNQTANIWTHALGLIHFQYVLFYCFPEHVVNFSDRLVLILAHLGIASSFLFSVIYHVFNSCTFSASCFLSQVDYFGIILHLLLVLIALVYYATYSFPLLQIFYVTFYVLVLLTCLWMNYHCMLSSVTNKMSSAQRSWFFVVVAAASLPPSFMVGPMYGWWMVFRIISNDMIYVAGALVYATKYPERLRPGLFDLFNSHTIFHLFIIAAGYQTTVSLGILSKMAIDNYSVADS